MRKYLIASHGQFSSGIKSSLDMIVGNSDVHVINAYEHGNKSIEEDLTHMLTKILPGDELIIFTDLMGGSVTNQVVRFMPGKNVHIVAGVNLPLLLEVLLADKSIPIAEVIGNAISNARDQIIYVNNVLKKEKHND